MKTPIKTQLQRRNCRRHEKRGGYTTAAIAFALLVAMAGFALLIDRMWLDAADMELTVAAESAALAAAAELAGIGAGQGAVLLVRDSAGRLMGAAEATSAPPAPSTYPHSRPGGWTRRISRCSTPRRVR